MFDKFSDSLKRENGFDVRIAIEQVVEAGGDALRNVESELQRFRDEIVPGFVDWNQLQRWKVSLFVCFHFISELHICAVIGSLNFTFVEACNCSYDVVGLHHCLKTFRL